MSHSHIVYIGIGSNIDPEVHLTLTAGILRAGYPKIQFSRVYGTAPRDAMDQADFLNAVARIETDQSPAEIHETLKHIERAQKKKLRYPKGPRTIDLDVLLYDDKAISIPPKAKHDSGLTIPHPRMHLRRFVLEPLCELIDPHAKHPRSGEVWNVLLKQTEGQKCKRIGLKL